MVYCRVIFMYYVVHVCDHSGQGEDGSLETESPTGIRYH